MDTKRTESPIYARRWTSEPNNITSNSSHLSGRPHHVRTSSAATIDSPTASPTRGHHARTTSATTGMSSVKRTQNFAARAAAQRLAQVMASQTTDEDDDEDDDDDTADMRFPAPALSRNIINGVGKNVVSSNRKSSSTRSSSPAVSF